MTVIEVKPRKWGWCVFESPGVEPVFLQKDQAIGYAETRARLRTGEIRIFDSTGKVERVIAFDDANRGLLRRFECFAVASLSLLFDSSSSRIGDFGRFCSHKRCSP